MELKIRICVAGGHTHVGLFMGPAGNTKAKCGDIVFRNEEWELVRDRIFQPFETLSRLNGGDLVLTFEYQPSMEDAPARSND
jgi:hypothetical protein